MSCMSGWLSSHFIRRCSTRTLWSRSGQHSFNLTRTTSTPGREAAGGADSEAELRYHLHEGPLMRLIRRAAENPHNEYAVVIDEINRGDVSRILGPLISAIEPDKRAGAEFPIGFESQYHERRTLRLEFSCRQTSM